MSDNRPEWTAKEISEHDFAKIYDFGNIRSVAAHMEMTSADMSREWLVASNGIKTVVLPQAYSSVLEFCGHWSNPGLFKFNYNGERCRKNLKMIRDWEKKNAADRAAFERLKRKFEPPHPTPET